MKYNYFKNLKSPKLKRRRLSFAPACAARTHSHAGKK